MKTLNWIILHPKTGWVYCKDRKWRDYALGGTLSCCIKVYKHQGNAQRQADKIRVDGETHIISLEEHQYMEANRKVFGRYPALEKGYEVVQEEKPFYEVKTSKNEHVEHS